MLLRHFSSVPEDFRVVEFDLDSNSSPLTLDKLQIGEIGIIDQISSNNSTVEDGLRTRLIAMGLIENKTILVMKKAFMGGPIAIRVGSTTELAIRRSEAKNVILKPQIYSQAN